MSFLRRLKAKNKLANALTYLIQRKTHGWDEWVGVWEARELLAAKYKEI